MSEGIKFDSDDIVNTIFKTKPIVHWDSAQYRKLYELAEEAIKSQKDMIDEDIQEWAERIAKEVTY